MADLVTWLRAQLDEDEDLGHAAGGNRWVATDLAFVDDSDGRRVVRDEYIDSGVRAHIVRHDPGRVLREIEAKRGILDQYEQAREYYTRNRSAPAGELHGLETAVRLLASACADRPGYRDEWRPGSQ